MNLRNHWRAWRRFGRRELNGFPRKSNGRLPVLDETFTAVVLLLCFVLVVLCNPFTGTADPFGEIA